MRFQNDKGEIQISSEVFTTITGAVATSCFGVKGMAARSKKDGLVHLLRSESMAKGVRVIFEEDDTVSIELHIIVDAGVNLTAVSSSIMSEVRYAVGNMTGAQVRAVDVYVDSMEIDLAGYAPTQSNGRPRCCSAGISHQHWAGGLCPFCGWHPGWRRGGQGGRKG